MLKDYELLTYNFPREITIIPLSDLHIGASNCNLNEIKKVVNQIKEKDDCYTILCGDIIDNAVLVGKNLGMFDAMSPMKSIQQAIEILEPIKDKILCVLSGNHEARSEKVADVNPLLLICSELGIKDLYRSSLGIVKIQLGNRESSGKDKRQTYTFLIHHGKGTSETAIKKDLEFINQWEGCDCIITGHTHAGRVAKKNKKVINPHNNNVIDKQIVVVVCNSFLNDADYALKNMMVGTSNDIITIKLKLGHKKILTEY